MRSQTMGSQGGAVQDPKMQESIARQGSLYSLTLDEVQNQLGDLGKPLGSMNLDELLKSVWTAETNQPPPPPSESSGGAQAASSSLPREGSLTLFTDLMAKKTVDEVWRDIQQKKSGGSGEQERKASQDRHATLGEMTLEDFLVKAGVVSKSGPAAAAALGGSGGGPALGGGEASQSQHIQWMQQYHLQQQQQQRHHHHQMSPMAVFIPGQVVHHHQPPVSEGGSQMLDPAAAYEGQMMLSSPSSMMGGTLSDTQTPGRKRVASEDGVEKTVERRQKRMIKNRESAARSRARRQAYTHELENKVSRLEEENERLRRQKEIEKILPSTPAPEPKNPLRRTSSATF